MQATLKKVLSFALVLVMVLGIVPIATFADEAQNVNDAALPIAMDGLSIAYPYNTENIQLTQTPVSRFDALTFESARNEVESAQLILTPDFQVDSFELTMNSLKNENGNIIPGWAFDVFVQHYVSVTGAGNAANYGQFETQDSWFLNKKYSDYLYHPRAGKSAPNGTYPNALIPQDAAIANGVNTISAGQNGGIWVNLNVQSSAPGTYTGFATLTVNGNDMQIPVSVRIYDVEIPDEVHSIMSTGIWWDQLEAGEGYMNQSLADSYYEYLISKRISPWNRYNYWYTTDGLVSNVVDMASDPTIPAYLLYYSADASDVKKVDRSTVVTTLTALINKNIELANAGNNVDLFKKAYFYFTNVDEPAGGSSAPTYKEVQAAIDVLDSVKGELAPMLDAYPDLQESFLSIKNIVTGPNPANAKNDLFYIDGCPEYSASATLTTTYDSVIYCPQYQNLQTAEQRAKYADDTEVWWYGCCHPVAPYPTFHYNSPLVNSRALGFMMYEYGISGAVYSSVNYWGQYTDNGISLYDYWNGYSSGTPGDQMLVYPGSDFGVDGPIGSMRIETIRESSEDYEYLWLLEQFGGNISAYTAGLYDGAIVTGVYDGHTVDPDNDGNTDSNSLYHTRRTALLSKLEELNVAANGATEIAPGQEGFVRGQAFTAGKDTYFDVEDAAWKTLSFDYKTNGTGELALIIRGSTWTKYYGDYRLTESGEKYDYAGITTEPLDDGYIHVTVDIYALTRTGCVDNLSYAPTDVGLIDIFQWTTVGGYIDNIQLSMESPEPEVTEPEITEPAYRGSAFTAGKSTLFTLENAAYETVSFDYKLTTDGNIRVIFRDAEAWLSFYGDYTLDAGGETVDYAGVTTEVLEDGYVRATFRLAELARSGCVDNRDKAPAKVGYLDIYDWTTASGYVDNLTGKLPCSHNYESVVTAPTFAANGYTTYTCTLCGKSYTDAKTAAYTASVKQWNIALADDIRANFHLELDSRIIGENTTVTATVDGNGYRYNLSELSVKDGLYALPVNVAAAQMTDEISIQVTYGELVSEEMIYSIRQYAEYILTNSDDENTKLLVQRMLNYGAAAQTYFVYNTGHLANAGYEMTDVPTIPEAPSGSAASGTVDGISYYGASLLYETRIGVRFYFTVTGDINSYTFSNGVKATYKSGMYYVDVLNINPNEYDNTIELSVTNGTDTLTVGYSPLRYISRKYHGSDNNDLVALVGAMYQYHLAAEAYLGEDQIVYRGQPFTAGKDTYFYQPEGDYNVVSFEYKTLGDGELAAIIRGTSWTKYYGDFRLTQNGEKIDYPGVTTEVLEDGYVRVTFDLPTLNRTGCVDNLELAPTDIGLIDIFGAWTTVDGYIDNIQLSKREVYRGQPFTAGKDTYFYQPEGDYNVVSFEYKTVGEGELAAIIRGSSWSKYYGDFRLTQSGEKIDYPGVTTEVLEDGYIRVTFDLPTLNRTGCVDNLNNAPSDIGLIDIFGAWTTVDGYIDNIQLSKRQVYRGQPFTAAKDSYFYLDQAGDYDILSFDYKTEASGEVAVIIRGSKWSTFYGDFRLTENGEKVDYAGITTEVLEDGYIRATFDLKVLQRSGCVNNRDAAPVDIKLIDIYNWTTVNGYIDNIQVSNKPQEDVIRGESFTGGVTKTKILDNDATETLRFDYKLTTDGDMHLILRARSWKGFYGDFEFNANGEAVDYDGITIEKLSDGYIRVTVVFAELNRTGCANNRDSAPESVGIFDIYSWGTADGYVDNIQLDS